MSPEPKPGRPSLRVCDGKAIARSIFHDVLAAVDIHRAMLAKVQFESGSLVAGNITLPLPRQPRVIAFGKAASRMAAALHEILGGRIAAGIAVAPRPAAAPLPRFRYFSGGHPYPNLESLAGAESALDMLKGLSPEDTVIFLISGGGSALFEKPLDPELTLSDLIRFNRVLVTCGLPIETINLFRKHISAVKGGRLARAAHPASQLTIYISDVPEGMPSMVASGPTMPDDSICDQCYLIAKEHRLLPQFPLRIRKRFEECSLEETPKPGDPCFSRSSYFCLLSNTDAVKAAKESAEKRGFVAVIDPEQWDLDYRELADRNLMTLDALAQKNAKRPVALIVGGEVTCPVNGPGMGGRNQAFALYAASKIGHERRLILSAGTDGRDGNSPSTGAIADGQTVSRAQALGLDPARYLAESDSYYFFRTLGDTLDIGFTENNVRDIRLWLDFGNS